ncbi:MAG: hypothetical protein E4H48_05310 [Syntrophobacterales bacterium]|nr:MAG: hypothetical protein E4H48_05310 [Syntrophobacterales bacterium]
MDAYGITDENSDTDGDGLAAWQEYRAGTDPARFESVLAITEAAAEPAADRFIIKWQAVDGKTYSVHSSTNLVSNLWNTNAIGIPGIEPECAYTSGAGEAETFFKIDVE